MKKKLKPKVQWSGYGVLGNISQRQNKMNREEFYTAIESFLSENKIGEKLIPRELVAGLSDRLAKLSLPPAEGAEAFLDEMELGEPLQTGEFYYRSEVLEAMNKFATLHAQRIADKMVSERLREELIHYTEHEWSYNPEFCIEIVDEYLKTREK